MSRITVALSYFHRKNGPSVFYSYPEDSLDRELSVKIANIMDLYNEGFFTHRLEGLRSLNYYFEIHSDWARGKMEMFMVSTIIDKELPPKIEEKIAELSVEFSERLKSNEEIFTAFYINDISYHKEDKALITKNEVLIRAWLKELYGSIIEVFRNLSKSQDFTVKVDDLTQEEINKNKELFKKFRGGDDDYLPFPFIFNPPTPPREAGAEAQLKPEYIQDKKMPEMTYCKHCDASLPHGALICPACGKKI
ncbi:MAG: hypothetical protein ACFFFB_13640 [Candidatus Heimdallarchaeota archaeon]